MRNTKPRRSPSRPTVAQPTGPKPADIMFLDQWHEEAMDYVGIAVEVALQDRVALKNKLPRMPINADMIISGFVDHVARVEGREASWLAWKTMLNIVVDILLSNPRFHGITDPVSQQGCTQCRKPLDKDAFEPGHVRCMKCEEANADV